MLNSQEYLKLFAAELDAMYDIAEKKNADYCGASTQADGSYDPFHNFRMVETLGITTPETAILVRMTDKMARISSLIHKDPAVVNEAITDTLQDLANYSIILKLYLEQENIE